MATRLLAPSMGEGIEELTVVNWLKKEGETVKEMEMIVELETDKVTTEIPSPTEGTLLKILVQKDQTVKVGATLAWIGQPGEALESESPTASTGVPAQAPQPAAAETPKPVLAEAPQAGPPEAPKPAGTVAPTPAALEAPSPAPAGVPKPAPAEAPGPAPVEALQTAAAEAPKPAAAPQPSTYSGFISPLVKNLVAANQVDLNLVHGTGLGGRITKEDVLNYLETHKPAAPAAAGQPAEPEAAAAPGSPSTAKPAALEAELIPLNSLRRQIAERMVNSQHTSPHVLTVMEADLSRVLEHRLDHKAGFAAQGVNLTLTAYFCSAIVSGLKACPDVNCSYTEAGLQRYHAINLGVAVALGERGLIVPVIRHAELLSLQGLAQQVNDLSARARSKKLLPEEVRDGTFTLTNHGLGGSLFAAPIIVQPQAAILGTGMMQKRAVVVTDASGRDAIAIRPMIYLSLVFDHRILDGESADRFLKVVKETLENWEQASG